MFSVKRRVLTAASVILAASTLAGCAVPGQGDPGVAAEGAGVTVTLAQVQEYGSGLTDLGIVDQSDWALTLALVHDAVIKEAADLGDAWSDDQISTDIDSWLTTIGYADGTASPAAIDVVRTAKALDQLATSQEGATFLSDLATRLETESISSPRFGDFTATTFFSSLTNAANTASSNASSVGDSVFIVFVAVTGFADAGATPSWFGESDAAAATASPEPSASASAEPSATASPSATAGE
ncbi:hypothetical protein RN607_02815 [Demequina capsici]|uniref:Lipoprotein n=1 Tax=Demequina capsici TaxID=3075620 RepID=A0AA96FEM9_9MICO|nr:MULTISPECIES: hypothetical protein [unclassified Demequina]WNM25046.1 hypothetical protein RN606_02545 [Demequina sp. OYTSA14]WNM27952.1 hypothetical protein RN607_02815 [Demequina sp. PMTSA13]